MIALEALKPSFNSLEIDPALGQFVSPNQQLSVRESQIPQIAEAIRNNIRQQPKKIELVCITSRYHNYNSTSKAHLKYIGIIIGHCTCMGSFVVE